MENEYKAVEKVEVLAEVLKGLTDPMCPNKERELRAIVISKITDLLADF